MGQTWFENIWDISEFPLLSISSYPIQISKYLRMHTYTIPFQNVLKQSTLPLYTIDELRISTCNKRKTYFDCVFIMFSDIFILSKQSDINILTFRWWKLAVDMSAWTGICALSISCSGFGAQSVRNIMKNYETSCQFIRLLMTFWWHLWIVSPLKIKLWQLFRGKRRFNTDSDGIATYQLSWGSLVFSILLCV